MIKIMSYRSSYVHEKRPELVEYLRKHLTLLAEPEYREMGSGLALDLYNKRPTIMFVAWEKGTPIGWASISFNPFKTLVGQIGCYVAISHRRQGIGTRLVSKAKVWCAAHDFEPIAAAWEWKGRSFYYQNKVPQVVRGWALYDHRDEVPIMFKQA